MARNMAQERVGTAAPLRRRHHPVIHAAVERMAAARRRSESRVCGSEALEYSSTFSVGRAGSPEPWPRIHRSRGCHPAPQRRNGETCRNGGADGGDAAADENLGPRDVVLLERGECNASYPTRFGLCRETQGLAGGDTKPGVAIQPKRSSSITSPPLRR